MNQDTNQPPNSTNEPEFTYSDDFSGEAVPKPEPAEETPEAPEEPTQEPEVPETAEQTEGNKLDKTKLTKAIGTGLIGLAASLGGFKSLHDVPVWLWQKYHTSPAEKKRLMEAMQGETSEEVPTSALDQRREKLEQAIRSSPNIPENKKQELLEKIAKTFKDTAEEVQDIDAIHNKNVSRLLDEHIETRVKGLTALKETLNTALVATGLQTLRGIGYGAVALYERHQRVSKEMEKGERTEGYFKELIANGVKETISKLALQEGKTKTEKGLNFVKAAGTLARFAGFGLMGYNELSHEGVSKMVDQVMDSLEQKGFAQSAVDNYVEQFHKVTLGGYRPEAEGGQMIADETPGYASGEAGYAHPSTEQPLTEQLPTEEPQTVDEPTAPESATVVEEPPQKTDILEQYKNPQPLSQEALQAKAEAFAQPEDDLRAEDTTQVTRDPFTQQSETLVPQEAQPPSREQIDLATIHTGDGFIRIAQRQLEADPVKFGYQGEDNAVAIKKWAKKAAGLVARKADVMNVGLTAKGIDKVALVLEKNGDDLGFTFVDAKTGLDMEPKELAKMHLFYDFPKTVEVPAEVPSNIIIDESAPFTEEEALRANTLPTPSRTIEMGSAPTHEVQGSHNSPTVEIPRDEQEEQPTVDARGHSVAAEVRVDDKGVTYVPGPESEPAEPTLSEDGSMLKFADGHNELSPAFRAQLLDQAKAQISTQTPQNIIDNTRGQMNTMVPEAMNRAGLEQPQQPPIQEQASAGISQPEILEPKPIEQFQSKLGVVRFEKSADGHTVKMFHRVDWSKPTHDQAEKLVGVTKDEVGALALVKAGAEGSSVPSIHRDSATSKFDDYLAKQTIAEEMRLAGHEKTKEYITLKDTNTRYLKKLIKTFPDLKDKLKFKPE